MYASRPPPTHTTGKSLAAHLVFTELYIYALHYKDNIYYICICGDYEAFVNLLYMYFVYNRKGGWVFVYVILNPVLTIKKEKEMFETIALILVLFWLVGLATSYTIGGLIHGLLIVAIVLIEIHALQVRSI